MKKEATATKLATTTIEINQIRYYSFIFISIKAWIQRLFNEKRGNDKRYCQEIEHVHIHRFKSP